MSDDYAGPGVPTFGPPIEDVKWTSVTGDSIERVDMYSEDVREMTWLEAQTKWLANRRIMNVRHLDVVGCTVHDQTPEGWTGFDSDVDLIGGWWIEPRVIPGQRRANDSIHLHMWPKRS